MRFKRVELSPANKKQYLIALGVKDIELLLGEATNAARYMPNVGSNKPDRERLDGIRKGLQAAYDEAKRDGDDGDKVPLKDRAKYKQAKENNPMLDVTRLEIVDYTKPLNAGGGRTVIFNMPEKVVKSSVQDNGRTLKLFIDSRPEDDVERVKNIDPNPGFAPFFTGDPEEFVRKMLDLMR